MVQTMFLLDLLKTGNNHWIITSMLVLQNRWFINLRNDFARH